MLNIDASGEAMGDIARNTSFMRSLKDQMGAKITQVSTSTSRYIIVIFLLVNSDYVVAACISYPIERSLILIDVL